MTNVALFVLAAVLEIAGCFAFWVWVRRDALRFGIRRSGLRRVRWHLHRGVTRVAVGRGTAGADQGRRIACGGRKDRRDVSPTDLSASRLVVSRQGRRLGSRVAAPDTKLLCGFYSMDMPVLPAGATVGMAKPQVAPLHVLLKHNQATRRHPATPVAAFVGLVQPLTSNAKGILRRCQLDAIEFACPTEACRIVRTIAPDALVVDSHHPELARMSTSAKGLLRELRTMTDGGQPVPLLVLSSAELTSSLRAAFLSLGALLLPTRRQTYRQIAATLRRLCDLPGPCCEVGETPHLCFYPPATSALHGRHRRSVLSSERIR